MKSQTVIWLANRGGRKCCLPCRMADLSYFGKPTGVTDERVRDAMEKQMRQRALREELDSQREQQREARAQAGLPTGNEPMTRAQRHRLRIEMEREEQRKLEHQIASPISRPGDGHRPQQTSTAADVLQGTFGRQAPNYSTRQPALPPIAAEGPTRSSPPGLPPTLSEESIYGWGGPGLASNPLRQPVTHPPTPPQQSSSNTFARQIHGADPTLPMAPPSNATQEQLASWLAEATERIRQFRGEQSPREEVQTRGRGPATRSTKVREEACDDSKKNRGTSSQSRTRSQSNTRPNVRQHDPRVAQLEATVATQLEQMRRMREKQQAVEEKVSQLNKDLKNAKEKEKHLAKAVGSKSSEKRAETAPKPTVRASKSKETRPITAAPLAPIEDGMKRTSTLPPIPEHLQSSFGKQVLPTPREHERFQPVPSVPQAAGSGPQATASLSLAQLMHFTEAKILSHKQVQQLWEVFAGARRNHRNDRHELLADDEDFSAPLNTFETYEDLLPDDEEDC
jgi:hypothetical protein